MKYKSLLVLSLAVVLTSCKMEEIQDNISVSGYWAQLNSVSQAKSFLLIFFSFMKEDVWSVYHENRSYGLAVRCQKE